MSEPKVGPTEFQAEVERLHAAGKLPKLEDLLGAVGDVRKEYAPKILAARKQGEQPEENE
jgi:hypothetical protein